MAPHGLARAKDYIGIKGLHRDTWASTCSEHEGQYGQKQWRRAVSAVKARRPQFSENFAAQAVIAIENARLLGAPPGYAKLREREPIIVPRPEQGLGRLATTKQVVHTSPRRGASPPRPLRAPPRLRYLRPCWRMRPKSVVRWRNSLRRPPRHCWCSNGSKKCATRLMPKRSCRPWGKRNGAGRCCHDPAAQHAGLWTPRYRCCVAPRRRSNRSLRGHQRHFERRPDTSALPPIPDVMLSRSERRSGPISANRARWSFHLRSRLPSSP
jgi:hypothetical protein